MVNFFHNTWMAAVRKLLETSVPRWSPSWSWEDPTGGAPQLRFVVMHDRSIDVILNNHRGEGFVKQVFLAVLQGCAGGRQARAAAKTHADVEHEQPPRQHELPPLVLDVGANTGYYSMLSGAHHCAVLAVDAQPGCAQWFEAARRANRHNESRADGHYFSRRSMRLVTRPLGRGRKPIDMDAHSCWVMHKTDVHVRGRAPTGRVAAMPLGSRELLDMVTRGSRVLLAKVDTEGAEVGVVPTLFPLMRQVENLVVEVAPGWWPLYANRSLVRAAARSSLRKSKTTKTVRIAGSGDGRGSLELTAAQVVSLRESGAARLTRLMRSEEAGGAGFQGALTSTGRCASHSARTSKVRLVPMTWP